MVSFGFYIAAYKKNCYPEHMKKIDITQHFAVRLRDTMMLEGYTSSRSTSGVDICKLAEITGYSQQICRKYLRGQAIPEPSKLIEIASKLNVSPGWLLFGDDSQKPLASNEHLSISKRLLHYIFAEASALYTIERSKEDIADFLVDLIVDLVQINADEKQLEKIIDLALSSARHFED